MFFGISEKLKELQGSEQTKLPSRMEKIVYEQKEPYENKAKIESDEYKKEEKLEGPKEVRGVD